MFQYCNAILLKKILLSKINKISLCCNEKSTVAKCNLWTLFFAGGMVQTGRKSREGIDALMGKEGG